LGSAILALVAISGAGCASKATASSPPAPASAKPSEPEPWCTAGVARSTEKAQGISGPLSDLSERFREAHQRARAEACGDLASHKLTIRYAFGTIEGRWNGRDLGPPVSLFTPHVHALKAVSHVVLLAALLFDEPAGAQRDAHLAASVKDIEALRVELGDPFTQAAKVFPPDEIPRQVGILTLTSAALRALRDGRSSESARLGYFSAVRAPLSDNLRSASAAVLTLLHQTVEGYKREVDAEDSQAWASLVVVAAVAHQARAREIAVQYFERRLGEAASEGASGEDRLVVVESQFNPADQRGGLAAHDVDRRYAATVFGQPNRLQWDVLADSGGLLDQLLAPPPAAGRPASASARRGDGRRIEQRH
jgi:hypothetical protein